MYVIQCYVIWHILNPNTKTCLNIIYYFKPTLVRLLYPLAEKALSDTHKAAANSCKRAKLAIDARQPMHEYPQCNKDMGAGKVS